MDYGSMIGDSFVYAKDAVIGKWMQWFLLVIATILLMIPLMGYTVRVLRGDKPAPEVNDWGGLIVDGIKYIIISIIYALPALIILFAVLGAAVVAIAGGTPAWEIAGLEGMLFGLVLFLIVAIICALFGTIGLIRFARTGSVGEAFNFPEIKETIGEIGWGSYIVALIIMGIIQMAISFVFSSIISFTVPVGLLIELVFLAPVVIFESRYLALVYESAGTI